MSAAVLHTRFWMPFLAVACVAEPWPRPPTILYQQFATEHQEWREYRRSRLVAPGAGPVIWIGLWELRQGATPLGADSNLPIVLPASDSPRLAGTLHRTGSEVRLDPAPRAGLRLADGTPVRAPLVLASDRSEEATDIAVGSLRLRLHGEPGTDRLWLRAWDENHPARETFTLPPQFPLDTNWRVAARFRPYPEPRASRVVDVTGGPQEFTAPGDLEFRAGGREHRLVAFASATSTAFFVMFWDSTATTETYEAGRYLRVPFPDDDGWTVIDFNRAYNAPCVFTPYSTCALPPPENRLTIAVPAGEKRARTGPAASVLAGTPIDGQQRPFVYISNLTGTSAAGRALTTIEDQTTRTLERLGEALRAQGLDYGNVAAVNVFLKDARHFQAMNQIYRRVFTADPPTRATVQADLPDPDALIQVSVIAARGAKQVIRPRQMMSPALPYSWGVRVGNTLFIAGATSRSPETYEPVTGDVDVQTRRVMGNIGLVLAEAGMSHRDLVSCRVFLDDPRRFGPMNVAYAESVPADDPPARATVRAGLMNPAFNVEIQCIAESSADRRVVIGEGRQRSRAPLSPAISTGDRLYLSGMVGNAPDVAAQTRLVLDNLRATLQAARMDFRNVVNLWVYLTDIRQWDAVKAVMNEVLPPGMPAETVIGAPLMGSTLLVEIEMVAER